MPYEPAKIDAKWQRYWLDHKTFRVDIDPARPKLYVLDMFPYPSGEGLHVGHPKGYVATDVYARYQRMRGFNVLHPMGWDAFGLPAEQHAVKTGQDPRTTTDTNIAYYKQQLQSLGLSYDWDREISTCDPRYFKWTQWIFTQLCQRGLAYEAEVPVNWCPELGTVLANEEVIGGKSERGGHPVLRLPLRQWMLKITAYADRLIDDLEAVDWPENIKKMQRDWIGRSEGATVAFPVVDLDASIEIYTTRPDTLFGATYMVLAPEHELVERVTARAQAAEVRAYVEAAGRKSERARISDIESKTGVFTGGFAENPVNGERIPVWVADYVLASYGTGAIMSVPGHDERDYAFAKAFDLPIREVVTGGDLARGAYPGDGVAVNSGLLDGLPTAEAKVRINDWLEAQGVGHRSINYKLRDWLFSRQRYWGEPFPVLHFEDGSTRVLTPEELPLDLPELADFKPSGEFEPPLARVKSWIEVDDGGRAARRDANTMPQWAGSCWYYLRFCDPHNDDALISQEAERYWMNVDLYVGGAEHAVLHLLYARFWHKVLYDLGVVHTTEPFQKLLNPGMIQGKSYRFFSEDSAEGKKYYSAADVRIVDGAPLHIGSGAELSEEWVEPGEVRWRDGRAVAPELDVELEEVIERMSKSRGNVVNPDDVIAEYGADAMRLYEMFIGPLDRAAPWSTEGMPGVFRFLQRVYRLFLEEEGEGDRLRALPEGPGSKDQQRLLAKTIAKVAADYDELGFNTALSQLMILVRDVEKDGPMPRAIGESFLKLLAPLAPHLAEELWERLGHESTIAFESWPALDAALLQEEEVDIVVQVKGKVRAKVRVAADADEETVREAALAQPNVQKYLGDGTPRRVIYVPGRLLNIVP